MERTDDDIEVHRLIAAALHAAGVGNVRTIEGLSLDGTRWSVLLTDSSTTIAAVQSGRRSRPVSSSTSSATIATTLWHLIAFRGLRRGEACSLDRSELSLTRATATIRTGSSDEPTDRHVTTKNQRARTVGLDRATVEVLRTHRQQQLQQKELLGDLYEDSGLVFTDELGRPLNLTTVSHHFDRLLTRYEAIRRSPERPRGRGRPTTPEALASAYGMPLRAVELALNGPPLPPVRLHDLRHGAASLTYRATRDLKLVSELLGHSGIQITADTYTTLFQEVDTAAAEAVARLVPRRDVHTTCAPADKPDLGMPDDDLTAGL